MTCLISRKRFNIFIDLKYWVLPIGFDVRPTAFKVMFFCFWFVFLKAKRAGVPEKKIYGGQRKKT